VWLGTSSGVLALIVLLGSAVPFPHHRGTLFFLRSSSPPRPTGFFFLLKIRVLRAGKASPKAPNSGFLRCCLWGFLAGRCTKIHRLRGRLRGNSPFRGEPRAAEKKSRRRGAIWLVGFSTSPVFAGGILCCWRLTFAIPSHKKATKGSRDIQRGPGYPAVPTIHRRPPLNVGRQHKGGVADLGDRGPRRFCGMGLGVTSEVQGKLTVPTV